MRAFNKKHSYLEKFTQYVIVNELHIVDDYYPQQSGSETKDLLFLREMQELSDHIDFCMTFANRYEMVVDVNTLQVFKELKNNINRLSRRIRQGS